MRTLQRSTTVGGFVDDSAEARFRTAYAEAMARLPEPTTTETIATRFGRVHVYRFGDHPGVPLVLLPGRNGCTSMWEPNLPTWAAHRTVYAVEVLGEAGLSVQEQPIRDTDDQAAWLGETLRGLGLGPAHVVGVSFGGWLAANLALHDPRAVASLSLIEPVQVLARLPVSFVVAALGALPAAPAFVRNRALSWMLGGAPVDQDPGGRASSAAAKEYRVRTPMPAWPTDDALRGLDVPTLALLGGRSRVHDPHLAYDRARSLLPDVEAVLWPDASHALSGERAEEVARRVLEFVDGVDARDPRPAPTVSAAAAEPHRRDRSR